MVAFDIYKDIVDITGNVGQYPEEEKASMEAWLAANCPDCNLQIKVAHKGYAGQDPVNPQNVTFDWADSEIAAGEHVKLWVVEAAKILYPDRPTSKEGGSHELTYMGRLGGQARIHDSDCDIDGTDDDYYDIDSDGIGDYLVDYFGPGAHGYLHTRVPSITTIGIITLIILLIAAAFLVRRKYQTA